MTRFDIRILGDERAAIDGEPVVPAPGESLHEAVLDRLQRSAQRLGRPVEATVDDGPGAAHFLLEVSPDGSSRILTTEPSPTGPKPSAPDTAPEPVSQSEPGRRSRSEPETGPEPRLRSKPGSDTGPDAKTRAELGTEPEPESKPGPEPGLRPGSKAGTGPELEPETGSDTKTRAEPGPGPRSGLGPETGLTSGPGSQPDTGPEPGAEPDTGPEPGLEAPSEQGWPEQEAEPETEAAAPGPRPRVRDSAVATAIARARATATAATAHDRSDAPPDARPAGPPADSDARPVDLRPADSDAPPAGLPPTGSDAPPEAQPAGPPPAGLPPAESGVGADVPDDIADRVVRINALTVTGRLDEAFAEATALRESLSGAAGTGHPYALEARALEAYVAHLRGDHRQATVLALSVARIRCGAGDERAPTEVARAAAAWQLLDDDRAVVVHGRELLGMWDGLSRRGPLPAGHTELAAQVRALVESLEAQRVLAPLA